MERVNSERWPGKKRSRGEFFNGGPHSKGVNHRGGPPSDLLINSFDRSKYSLHTLPFCSTSSTLAATSASPNSSLFSDKRRVVVVWVGVGVAVVVGVGVCSVETASRRKEIECFDLLDFPTSGVKSRRITGDKLAGKMETPVTAMAMLVNSLLLHGNGTERERERAVLAKLAVLSAERSKKASQNLRELK